MAGSRWVLPLVLATLQAGNSSTSAAGGPPQEPFDPVMRGTLLLAESQCLECHAPPDGIRETLRPRRAPSLQRVTERTAPNYLRSFLLNPAGTQPGTTMPDVLGGVDLASRESSVDALLAYLARGEVAFSNEAVEFRAAEVERGRELFHRKGCVACHAPGDPAQRFDPELGEVPREFAPATVLAADRAGESTPWRALHRDGAVPLPDLPAKTSLDALTRFLLDPKAVRPSGRMPDLMLEEKDARSIAAYLFARDLQGPAQALLPVEPRPGVFFDYYEAPMSSALPDFDTLGPTRSGVSDQVRLDDLRRSDHFAYRWSGFVQIPQAGVWTFYSGSDDGSQVFVNGGLVVDHDGVHATSEKSGSVFLEAGLHDLEATFFERDGGEAMAVSFSGPGVEKRELGLGDLFRLAQVLEPVEAGSIPSGDPVLGERLYHELGCANCHGSVDAEVAPMALVHGPALEQLDPDSVRGCLGDRPARPAPSFAFSQVQKDELRVALATIERGTPLPSATRTVAYTMAQSQCYACHERDGVGGPGEGRAPYFASVGAVDMGTEGQIPPSLTGVGAKLRAEWMRMLLFEGRRTRSFLATVMPNFDAAELGDFVERCVEADLPEGWTNEPAVQVGALEAGHVLVGKSGLSCIECHSFGEFPSRGMPAGDLAQVWQRLNPGWFRAWLERPAKLRKGTRMPNFFTPGELSAPEMLGGDGGAQIDALWSYLSLGDSAPVPEGLNVQASTYDLLVEDRPVLVGVFMENVSPRTLCVGYPERTHIAYDLENLRLARAWKGRFFNAKGTWDGRAGQLEEPPVGTHRIEFPAGPTLAALRSDAEVWPTRSGRAADAALVSRTLDRAGNPEFEYSQAELRVRERAVPDLRPGGAVLVHAIEVEATQPVQHLFWRIGVADRVELGVDGEFVLDGGERTLRAPLNTRVRRSAGRHEILVPLEFSKRDGQHVARAEVEIRW